MGCTASKLDVNDVVQGGPGKEGVKQDVTATVTSTTELKPETTSNGAPTNGGASDTPTPRPTPDVAASSNVTRLIDEDGNENIGAEDDRNTLEDLDYSLQDELNEVLEAVYELISEDDIQAYQEYLTHIQKLEIAQQAVGAMSRAPDFTLMDQDDEPVKLSEICRQGPVVLQFYRGKWCPHCNAGLMAYNKYLQRIQQQGARLIAISPMLPDGSQFLASKRDLQFAVVSDQGNKVAREYHVTFTVPEQIRPTFESWGHDVAAANGDDLWEVPLAATYIVNEQQEIVWSFVDNDHGIWAEPSDVVQALQDFCSKSNPNTWINEEKRDDLPEAGSVPRSETPERGWNSIRQCADDKRNTNGATRGKGSKPAQKPDKKTFGPEGKSAGDYVSAYPS